MLGHMNLFVSHESALNFWRSDRATYVPPAPCRVRTLDSAAVSVEDISAAADGWECLGDGPIHYLTNNPACRNTDFRRHAHLWQGHIPTGSFLRVDKGLFVASPELTFLQCTRGKSLTEAVLLGFELCGGYSLCESALDGFVQHEPLATVASIRDFASRLAAPKHIRRAGGPLRYIYDGAASPAEAATAMRLCLRQKLGGASLGGLELNAEIPVTGAAQDLTQSTRLFCDIYLPRHRIDIEYESYRYHSGSSKLAEDSERRGALASLGITVVTVTPRQLYSLEAFSALANHIRKLCGLRPFEVSLDWLVAQDNLCSTILSDYHHRYQS